MRVEHWAARLVLLLGLSVLVATSGPEPWRATKTASTSFESQGAGDDKLAVIRVQLGRALWRDAEHGVTVSLSGLANRPISDVRITWLNQPAHAGAPAGTVDAATAIPIAPTSPAGDAGASDAGVSEAGVGDPATWVDAGAARSPMSDAGLPERQHFDGFLRLSSETPVDFPCRSAGLCELLVEARISAEAAAPYAMDLEAEVSLEARDGEDDKPKGEFEVTLEVRDAP